MFALGVDAITLGNHTYRHREVYPYLDEVPNIVRPANFLRSQPGHGTCVVERDGVRLGVLNLSGNVHVRAGRNAFAEADAALHTLREDADYVLVDMHAEVTSEKVAMGWHLDGRVTAVVGTHTHVPTADDRVLPGGTAYITDVGMTGPRGGVIGVKRDQAIESLAHDDAGALRDLDRGPVADGRADHRVAAAAGRRHRAGATTRARSDVSATSRSALRAPTSTRCTGVAVDQVPVAGRELELGQHDRCRHRRGGGPLAPGPGQGAANGTSQITNCGESTFPSATKATSVANAQSTSQRGSGARAGPRRPRPRSRPARAASRSSPARRPGRPRGPGT